MRFLIKPTTKIKGILIPVRTNWSYPLLKSLFLKVYEGGEISIIEQTISDEDIILEIGTGLGLLSAYCARRIGGQNVFTYEANPHLEPIIKRTYQLNNVNPNFKNALVTLSTRDIDFFIEPSDIWNSSLYRNSQTAEKVRLKSININEIIETVNPSYLIMDIEGFEYELTPKITWEKIKKVQLEIHTKYIGIDKTNEIIDFLINQGFKRDTRISIEEQHYFYRF